MNHLDELAELYALGSLTPEEERRVNVHIATCQDCRARVNDAEKVVAAMAREQEASTMPSRSTVRRAPSAQVWPALGFAAGLVLPLLFLLPVVLHARQSAEQNHVVFSAIVNSHFSHVAFTPRTADAPHAKLLYARGGDWLYVVAVQPKTDLGVLVRSGHTVRAVGTLHAGLPDAEVFVKNPGPVGEVLLVRGGAIAASAHPVFTSEVHPP